MASECPYNCVNGYILMEALGGKVPCPHCNGIERVIEMTNAENPDNIYNVLKIPMQYRYLTPESSQVLINNLDSSAVGGVDAKEVAEILGNIVNTLDKGRVYRMSVYINIPTNLQGLDLNTFVYSAQIKALVRKVGTMPYITANMLYNLLQGRELPKDEVIEPLPNKTVEGKNGRTIPLWQRLRYVCGFDYWDYVTSPLVFIEASAGIDADGWIAIADLLGERARLSLPTYVIGYWSSAVKAQGKFLYTTDQHRLDRLNVFEFLLNKPKRGVRRNLFEVTSSVPDTVSEYGVKVSGFSTNDEEIPDYRDFV